MIRARPSRRAVMYLLVGCQMLVLGAIVVPQELNLAFDTGTGVDLEITGAQALKDPFRGAYISGRSALDLDGAKAALPAERLRPGDEVLVFFAVEAGRRPRIERVERRGADPPFGPTSFSIPGKVLGRGERGYVTSDARRPLARIGDPAVHVALEVPDSVPVDDAALDRIAWPSMIRASLRRGYLGHRYLTDVRLVGRGWSPEAALVYDATRERLVVLSPRRDYRLGAGPSEPRAMTELFFFDGLGTEAGSAEVAGRLMGGVVAGDGRLLALISDSPWGGGTASLAELGDDGRVIQRSPPVTADRVLSLDAAAGAVWVLTGRQTRPPETTFFVEALTPAGPRGPRLGPFASAPRAIVSVGKDVWVVETAFHRVTRLDRASGRVEQEFRDLNGPSDIAVDGGGLVAIEAERSQLSKLAADGRVLWRVPRFQGLAWVLAEPGTGGGWVGAVTFEGKPGGVFRFGSDGSIARIAPDVHPAAPILYPVSRQAANALREPRQGRLYLREPQAIAILDADGTLLRRVEGFRYPTPQRIRQ